MSEPIESNFYKEKVKELLAKTQLRDVQIASIVGCSPSYISQLKTEPSFMEDVNQLKMEVQLHSVRRDEKLAKLEMLALEKMEEVMDYFVKPGDVLGLLKTISNIPLRSKGFDQLAPDDVNARTVSIELPAHVTNANINIQVNTLNQVVEVEGREMRTMPKVEVEHRLEEMRQKREQNLIAQRVGNLLENQSNENSESKESITEVDSNEP